ncbi:MAG: undecaprenyl-diphosphatase UppP [Anaerolineae bacterium]|nr:undecaprenyl-diphosphatase UppP [Anaerolineae bacterium]
MNLLQAIVLGIVQGATEFIPISSSAHLIIIPWLFDWDDPGLAFDVALHLGTLVAVLSFFAREWVNLFRAGVASIVERKIGDDVERRLAWYLIIGTIPGALAGALFESKIEELFHAPNAPHTSGAMIAMGIIIALLGAALFVAERIARHTRALSHLALKDAILIGCAQALALFPGVSRSGATITAGLALGLERAAAARFSFLLSAPIIAGAGAKSAYDLARAGMSSSEVLFFAVGMLSAAISGYLCIKFLLRFLQRHSTDVFVVYRWLLAVFVIVVAVMRG